METNVAHVVCFFARVCSSNHFSCPFRHIFAFTLYMFFLRPPSRSSTTTSQSVCPSIRSLTCCSYSLCVCFLYFPSSHGSQLLFYSPLLYMIKMSSFHRVFLFIIVVAAFFFPLNIYKPRRELFSVCLPICGKQSSQG